MYWSKGVPHWRVCHFCLGTCPLTALLRCPPRTEGVLCLPFSQNYFEGQAGFGQTEAKPVSGALSASTLRTRTSQVQTSHRTSTSHVCTQQLTQQRCCPHFVSAVTCGILMLQPAVNYLKHTGDIHCLVLSFPRPCTQLPGDTKKIKIKQSENLGAQSFRHHWHLHSVWR